MSVDNEEAIRRILKQSRRMLLFGQIVMTACAMATGWCVVITLQQRHWWAAGINTVLTAVIIVTRKVALWNTRGYIEHMERNLIMVRALRRIQRDLEASGSR